MKLQHRIALLLLLFFSGAASAKPPLPELRVGDAGIPDLAAAIAKVPALRARLPQAAAATIILPAGTYRLTAPVVIDAAHGGTPDHPLVIRGAGAAITRFSGAVRLATRAATGADTDGRPLPPGTRAVSLAGLPAPAGLVRRSAGAPTPQAGAALFDGAAPLMPARWPQTGFAVAATSGTRMAARIVVPGDRIAAWRGEPALWAAGFWSADWSFERVPVAGIGADGASILLAPLRMPEALRPRVRFAVENAIAELRPGTMVLDPARRLALLLPVAAGRERIEAAVAPSLLVLAGAHDVTIRGIAFDRTLGPAVRIQDGRAIRVRDCAIRQTGGVGLWVEGGRDVRVTRTVVAHTAETGVSLSGGDRRTLAPGGLVFEDGIVADWGREQPSYRPAVRLMGVGNAVRNSLLVGGDHAAVIVSGNDHGVIGNEIADVIRATDDAGAIYMGADWSARGNAIAGNYLHDLGGGRTGTTLITGVYLDDQLSGAAVTGNVIVGGDYGVVIGGGRDTAIAGNLLVAPRRAGLFMDARGLGWQRAMLPTLKARLAAVPTTGSTWRARYPALAALTPDRLGTPDGNCATGNRVLGAAFLAADTPATAARLETTANEAAPLDFAPQDTVALARRAAAAGITLAHRAAALADLLPLVQVPDR